MDAPPSLFAIWLSISIKSQVKAKAIGVLRVSNDGFWVFGGGRKPNCHPREKSGDDSKHWLL
jgi:hypothetical protein